MGWPEAIVKVLDDLLWAGIAVLFLVGVYKLITSKEM